MNATETKTRLQLLHGTFSAQEALSLITQLIHQKIRFHEAKMEQCSNQEQVRAHANRIVELQRDLYTAKEYIDKKRTRITLEGNIEFT